MQRCAVEDSSWTLREPVTCGNATPPVNGHPDPDSARGFSSGRHCSPIAFRFGFHGSPALLAEVVSRDGACAALGTEARSSLGTRKSVRASKGDDLPVTVAMSPRFRPCRLGRPGRPGWAGRPVLRRVRRSLLAGGGSLALLEDEQHHASYQASQRQPTAGSVQIALANYALAALSVATASLHDGRLEFVARNTMLNTTVAMTAFVMVGVL